MEIIIIAAIAKNGIIGKDGSLPWSISEELKHFKETTMGYPLLMGRKTFYSINKMLAGRKMIVLSKNLSNDDLEDCTVFNNINEAISYCKGKNFSKLFILGGREIYAQVFDYVDRMILSIIDKEYEGDTSFPEFDENNWRKRTLKKFDEFKVVEFIRKKYE